MTTNLQIQNNLSSSAQYVQDGAFINSSLASSSGNTGMGTTISTERLEVNGNIGT